MYDEEGTLVSAGVTRKGLETMYRFWSNGTTISNAVDGTPLEHTSDGLLVDALKTERERQESVNLLRDRAYRARESTAEQQVQALQADLVELRASLAAERQSSQVRAHTSAPFLFDWHLIASDDACTLVSASARVTGCGQS